MSAAVPPLVRRQVAGAAAICVFLAAVSCAWRPAPEPSPPPPADPLEDVVKALTTSLTLDAAQQKKTRKLLQDMVARDDKIRAGWGKGEPVRPQAIVASHSQFEQDFQAILTEQQRKTLIENRTRLMLQVRGVRP